MFSAAKTSAPSTGAYTISRSVRLRSSASAYFNRTPASNGSSTTWTWSGWVKRGTLGGSGAGIFYAGVFSTSNDETGFQFRGDDTIQVFQNNGASTVLNKISSAVYRDPSAWYHLVCTFDTTNATAEDRVRLYVNGVRITSFTTNTNITQNGTTYVNSSSYGNRIFRDYTTDYLDGYLTEVNFIDGQALTPSSFGSTNTITGVWQPIKYTGTYGTNGFYLNFSDNSNNTATTIGKDYSGNGNNWTPNNISVTAGVTYDSMIDVPTLWADGGNGRGNYAVMNPLDRGGGTVADGNLSITNNTANHFYSRHSMQLPTSGKWYWEVTGTWDSNSRNGLGVLASSTVLNSYPWGTAQSFGWYLGSNTGNWYWSNNGSLGFNIIPSSPAVFQICYDADNGTIYAGINNTFYSSAGASSGNPSTLTNPTSSSVPAGLFPTTGVYQSGSMVVNHGQRPFAYTPPTGFNALNTYNLPASTISNGANYMAASTYTGNLVGQSIVNSGNNTGGISFKPDLVWVKSRSAATDHKLTDSNRGATLALVSDSTAAETTDLTGVVSFNTNGFTLGTSTVYNNTGATYVGWQWQAGQGTKSSNTNGSITSTVSVNATAGFSVVTYTGTGSAATIGHGLGVAPSMMIVKTRSVVNGWLVYHSVVGNGKYLVLSNTNATTTDSTTWNNTSPTSSVFSVGTGVNTNQSGTTYVAYLWSEVAGFSKFGSYTGNGSTDGPFVFTNFQPRWVMVKRTDSTSDWYIWDTSRDTYNVESATLLADTSGAETSATSIDGLSNGFKCRSATVVNASGGTYIYAAFASSPFKLSLAR